MSLQQRLVALMAVDHPLSGRRTIRLSDCVGYSVALAERSLGGRQLLTEVPVRSNLRFDIAAQSNSFEFLRGMVLRDNVISFQIEIGAVESNELVVRRIDDRERAARRSRADSSADAISRCRPQSSPNSSPA